MRKIIVTMTNEENSFFLDVELPVGYPVGEMSSCLAELINQNQSESVFKSDNLSLVINRLKKSIPLDMTLEEAGVWNGDYITIFQK